jgi:RNA polymerase sigma factor (TIGR02999 family)
MMEPLKDAGGITRLLREASQGDRDAEERLLRVLYDDLHRMARRHMRGERAEHTLQPTALLNEAFVRLLRGRARTWNDRLHFLGVASTVMRRVLVDHARRRSTAKRGQGAIVLDQCEAADPAAGPHSPERVLAIDEALEQLARLEPRSARVVELRFFAGLSNEEIAALLGVSPRTVKREWTAAKAWLYEVLGPGA